jgi:hypothetical protein
MDDYDRWVCEREDEREANRFDATPHFDSAGEAMRTQLEVVATERVQPPVGSYAATARMMAAALAITRMTTRALMKRSTARPRAGLRRPGASAPACGGGASAAPPRSW